MGLRDQFEAERDWYRDKLTEVTAERDRLRAEVAALRAAWPVAQENGPMPVGLVVEFAADKGFYVVPNPSVRIRGYVFPTRDAAIDAAAGVAGATDGDEVRQA
jgi:hypothetical protein